MNVLKHGLTLAENVSVNLPGTAVGSFGNAGLDMVKSTPSLSLESSL